MLWIGNNLNLAAFKKYLVYKSMSWPCLEVWYGHMAFILLLSCMLCLDMNKEVAKSCLFKTSFSSSKFSVCWVNGTERHYNSERASSLLAALNELCVLLCVRGKQTQIWVYSSGIACSSMSCSGLPHSHLPVHLHGLRQLKLRSLRQGDAMIKMNQDSWGNVMPLLK